MSVKQEIGAKGKFYMATGAAPETVVANGTYDKTKYIKSLTINTTIGNDDVTVMDVGDTNFAQEFIQALINSSGSFRALYGAPTGVFLLFLNTIKNSDNHSLGRGKVDCIYDPFGSVAGNLRFTFTLLLTSLPLGGELGTAVGGDVGFQCTGEVELGAVPA